MDIIGINDTPAEFEGMLLFGAFRWDGTYVVKTEQTVIVRTESAHVIAALPDSTAEIDGCDAVAFAVLYDKNGAQVSAARLVHSTYDCLPMEQASIDVQLEDGKAVFVSDRPVLGVCLDLDGESFLADNMFDLFAGVPYRLPWGETKPPEILFTLNQLVNGQ